MMRTVLRERLQVRNETLGEAIGRLEARGRITRDGGMLGVPIPHLRDRRDRNEPVP